MTSYKNSIPSAKARRDLSLGRHTLFGDDWHRTYVNGPLKDAVLPDITISIVLYNSASWIETCLNSICRLDYPLENITLLIVDHESSDNSCILVQDFMKANIEAFKTIKLFNRLNNGYGAGNDYSIRYSDDEFILVMNVDTELYPNSLRNIVTIAMRDSQRTACWEFRQAPYEHPKYYDPVTLLTNWASHAAILIRRSAYIDVGGYDTSLFMYGEDVELSYRFRQNGWNLRYVPTALVKHFVDLENLSVRPHQISGSFAANILLRYRYGRLMDIIQGELLFCITRWRQKDKPLRVALNQAKTIIRKNRRHFFQSRPSKKTANLSFNYFNYEIRRRGESIKHVPAAGHKPAETPRVTIILHLSDGDNRDDIINSILSVLNQSYHGLDLVIFDKTGANPFLSSEELFRPYDVSVKYVSESREVKLSDPLYMRDIIKGDYVALIYSGELFFADHIELSMSAFINDHSIKHVRSLRWSFQKFGENSYKQFIFQEDIVDDEEQDRAIEGVYKTDYFLANYLAALDTETLTNVFKVSPNENEIQTTSKTTYIVPR